MKTILFEGVVPPEKKVIAKINKKSLLKVCLYQSRILKTPFKLLNIRHVWNSKYSWEFNMVLKCLLDLAKFDELNIDINEVRYFGGDSLGTVTAAIAFKEVSILDGLKIVRRLGLINDRISFSKPGLTSIVYSTGRDGPYLEKEEHFVKLINSDDVVLSVKLSDRLCVVVGPTETIDKFIEIKPESIFIKILGRNKVTHYPDFKNLITNEDMEDVRKHSKNFKPSGKHLSNIISKNGEIVNSPNSFAEEALGCIDKLISVKQLYSIDGSDDIIAVGSNGYLEEIISSL